MPGVRQWRVISAEPSVHFSSLMFTPGDLAGGLSHLTSLVILRRYLPPPSRPPAVAGDHIKY